MSDAIEYGISLGIGIPLLIIVLRFARNQFRVIIEEWRQRRAQRLQDLQDELPDVTERG
jgi:hypothetical protein